MARAKLSAYRGKRDFTQTSEPRGGRASRGQRRRFVIQKHAARRLHYDLRLELDGVFRSWAVPKGPSLDPADKRLAVEVEDHPLEYGDFEGTIPKGEYGGGTVLLWDRGYWEPADDLGPRAALEKGHLRFSLEGERLRGTWNLVRTGGSRQSASAAAKDGKSQWLLIRHRDGTERPGKGDAALRQQRSVASGRTMADVTAGRGSPPTPLMTAAAAAPPADNKKKTAPSGKRRKAAPAAGPSGAGRRRSAVRGTPPARFIEPQLCRLVAHAPNAAGWAHEIKFDGYRLQLHVADGRARLLTRKGLNWTDRFGTLADKAARLPAGIYDGEAVALNDEGMPDFPALQAALSTGDTEGLVCFVFDLLFEGAEDLRPLPLRERKARLEGLLGDIGDPAIRYVEHFETAGDAVLESACRMDLEGIVSKRLDAPYRSGRTGSWTKTKCRGGQEVVIGGWRADQGRLRSLLAGVYRDGRLVYAGRIGTGFSGATAAGLAQRLRKLAADDSPFAEGPRPAKDVHWVRPELVAEIEHGGFTDAGLLRHAAFKALREDKPAREVSPEAGDEVESGKPARRRAGREAHDHVVLGVTISNPGKAIWPAEGDRSAITKLELARYYEVAGPLVLPHVADRPCSLVRTPDGIGGQHFYQRHAMPGTSSLIELVKIRGDRKPYLQFSRPEALVAAAQSGAVELHPWNCAPGDPERPGRYVFDLDPGPDVPFDAVIMAAQEIRERLAAIGLTGWCKTTGGKGLHVVVPLSRSRKAVSWPEAKALAAAICREMAEDSPDRHLVNMAKRLRKGRIFLDYLRNDRTATAVAPYSARARPGAPVSLPVRWEDVRPGLDPARFDVPAMMASLAAKHRKHSPWTGYEESARPLDQAIRQHGRQSAGPSTARRRAGSPPAPRQGRGASAGSTAAAR